MVDTSAWIEFLRDTGSPTCLAVDRLLADDLATSDPIRMELLAGARNRQHLQDLRGLLARTTNLAVAQHHWEEAARLYRACRSQGATVPKLIDCLIAAVAIEADVAILHADRDFEFLAAHSDLTAVTGDEHG